MLKFSIIQDPHEALKDYVWFTTVLEDTKTPDSSFNYDVVPLGDVCITFPILTWSKEEKGPAGMSFLLVAGAMSKLMRVMVTPHQVLLMRLKPGAFQAMFGIPAHKVKNKVIYLDKLWGAEGKAWEKRLKEAPDTPTRIQVFEEGLIRHRAKFKAPDPYAAKAVDLMKQADGKMTLEELSYRLGYTDRQVERKFEDGLGLTPKEYQRVLRCRMLILRMLNRDFKDWSDLVADYGYFDQAHLINEFKAFMGMSPEKFLKKFDAKGKILESPLPGVRDETAFLGYEEESDPRPPEGFIPIDVESVARQSADFPEIQKHSLKDSTKGSAKPESPSDRPRKEDER